MTSNPLLTTVPIEFSGQWIAWNFEETKILASGATYAEAKKSAELTGEDRPVLVKAPQADARFIGGHR
jgi:hypothetical protein